MPTNADLLPIETGPDYGQEVSQTHTRLLRVSLALEESRAYWENWRADIPTGDRLEVAFRDRWFGNKSMARVRRLSIELNYRYARYPVALAILARWQPRDPIVRQNLCHWHLQLTDPIYRRFSSDFLPARRWQATPQVDRDIAARWATDYVPPDWSTATTQRLATGLVAAAAGAGLCTSNSGGRRLTYPRVADLALAYWLYFLRHLTFQGSLLDNPYWVSVGLTGADLEQRLQRLPGLRFSRLSDAYDFGWQYPDLPTWAAATLELAPEVSR